MSKIITLFLLVSASVVVGLYAYLGSFSQLMADDFCSIYYAERLGLLRSVWYWYISWHGGYSASFADGLLGLFGRSGIGFVVPAAILFWVLSLVLSITSYIPNHGSIWRTLVIVSMALLVLYGTLILSPDASASIIWWGGLRGYIPPLIIMPFYLALYGVFSRRSWSVQGRYFWYVASFMIVLFSGGFSEPFTPLQIMILFLMLACELYLHRTESRSSRLYFLLAGLLGGILALVLMVMAPGNVSRQTFYPASPAPLEMISIALTFYLRFLGGLSLEFSNIATIVAVYIGSMLSGIFLLDARSKYFNFRNLSIVVFNGFLFAYCSFLPAAFGQSTGPSDTSLIIPVYILMLALVMAGIISGGILANSAQSTPHQRSLLLSVILVVSLGYSMMLKAQDLTAEIEQASVYAENWAARDQQIRRAGELGDKKVFVPAFPRWITLEPNDNPKFFVNQCMSLYYGITVISSVDANE